MQRFSNVYGVSAVLLASGGAAGTGVHEARAVTWSSDFDQDGDVDLADFGTFAACFNGPNRSPAVACAVDADLDNDTDVDLSDFATFAACFNGPNRIPACPANIPSDMVLIPAGEFQMGDTFSEAYTDERPVHAVSVDPFYMDATLVTNQQYADALNWAYGQGDLISVSFGAVYDPTGLSYMYCSTTSASTGPPYYGEWSRITWDGSTFGVIAGKEDHPMVMVSWYGSAAYANWRSAMQGKPPCYDLSTWNCDFVANGYRLATEAEWEKAARGGGGWSAVPVGQHHQP